MPSYWWECERCRKTKVFSEVTSVRGITHFILDVLVPSDWDQGNLTQKCEFCDGNLRIAYIFPKREPIHILVKHIIGLGPFDEYLPMMWETIPDRNDNETWFDFKYINGRKIWGLNKPAVFSKTDLKEIVIKYEKKTGQKLL
ncbi:MAG: hypothetical protein PHD82_05155 [Candidatus Riflebacteria bacterium]|nr:hypothetical protein [Candidatus Riflebacteria bacterium]